MVKYFFNFGSSQGDPANARTWRVEISTDSYVGVPIEVAASGNPVTVEYGTKSIFSPIRGSSMKVQLFAETDFQFEEFFQTVYGDYTATLIEDPDGTADIRWIGYNEANIYREPFIQPPYVIDLKFTDGLGHLKSVEFKDNDLDEFYTGQRHLLQTLRLCLNELGEINIVDIINIYENNQLDGNSDSMLTQTYTDVSTYRTIKDRQIQAWDCNMVLEKVLNSLNSIIFQQDGKWTVLRPAEQLGGSLTAREFLPEVGNESDDTVQSTTGILHTVVSAGIKALTNTNATMIGQSGDLNQGTQIQRFVYKYTPNHFSYVGGSILPNSFFFKDYGLTDFPLPLFWEPGASTTPADIEGTFRSLKDLQTKVKDEDNDGQPDQEVVVVMDATATTLDNNKLMFSEVDNIFIESTDHIGFKCEFNLVEGLPGGLLDIRVRIRLQEASSGDVYYFKENGDWTIANANPYILNITTYGIPGTSKVQAPKIGLGDPIPFSGKASLQVVVYRPVKSGGGNFQNDVFILKNISIDYLVSANNDSLPQRQLIYTEEISSVADRDTYEIVATHSDGLGQVSQNSFRLLNGDITQDWHRRGEVETLKIWELIAKDVLDLKADKFKMLSGTFFSHRTIGLINKLRTNITGPSGAVQIDFAVTGVKWNVKKDEYGISSEELDTHPYVSSITTIIDEASSPTPPVRGPKGSGGAKFVNQGFGKGGVPTTNQPANFPI